MNRKLLFRAWHHDLNKMLYAPSPFDSMPNCRDSEGNHVYPQDCDGDFPLGAHMTWDGQVYCNGVHQNISFMQFTGLTDKTGQKIWEGDIISLNKPSYPNYCIEYSDRIGAFTASGLLINTGCGRYIQTNFYTVIGNGFENPELLK